jgi:predicted transcriptional regulator
MKYRERNEIIAEILECCKPNRVTRSRIIFNTYLSFNAAKEYLILLLENGLIDYHKGERTLRLQKRECTF